MTDSKYPGQLDTDAEIPRVDDNITEIGGEAIDSVRSAVFNIEEALGINPQGTATDVTTRLSQSLNPDGTIKAAALAAIGLITLPIVNSMIASNAAIAESKLALNYGTAFLKAGHNSNYALIISLMNDLAVDISHLAAHVTHPSSFGRHRTSDIDGYAGTAYDGYNLQGIVNNLNTRIIRHLTAPIAAHAASAISFDDTGSPISASNVQEALRATGLYIEGATIEHQDSQHSNGVLSSQDVSFGGTNHSYVLIASSSINPVSAGTLAIQFASVPVNFSRVGRGDRVDIVVNTVTYTRYVDYTFGTSTIFFLTPLPISSVSATATVYKRADEYIAPAALNVAYRHRLAPGVVGGAIIQLVHPNAPFILSSGADPRGLSVSAANIKLGWGTTPYTTADINIYIGMVSNFSLTSIWTVENVAIQLNEDFSASHYPFVAFTYKGQLGIALDVPDGYISIQTPAGSSAWSTLGFSPGDVAYPLNRKFYIEGYEFTNVREILNTTGSVLISNQQQITSLGQNVVAAGVKPSGIVRVSNNAGNNGTYIFDNTSGTNTLVVNENLTGFAVGTNVGVKVYADTFNPSPSHKTLYELFIDGYDHAGAIFTGEKRLEYQTTTGGAVINYFDVVDVSRNFTAATRTLTYTNSGSVYTMQLGSGEIVTLPVPTISSAGYRFKTYDTDGINYVEFEVSARYSLLASGTVTITIYDRPSEKRYLQVGKVLHDTQYFKYLEDRRLFGTVGRADVRSDFTRDYISYPTSLLRKGGVIRDCSILTSIGATSFSFAGGEVLANGNVFSASSYSFDVPTDGVQTYNLYVDGSGVVRFQVNDQYVENQISTPSTQEIIDSLDKTILYVITTDVSSQILTITDVRKFVNNIDGKIELLIGSDSHGHFDSLLSAINYLNACGSIAGPRVLRIIGTVYVDSTTDAIVLPDNVVLEGETKNTSSGAAGSMMVFLNAASTIQLGNYITIQNLRFYSTYTNLNGMLSSVSAKNGVNINNCSFIFDTYRTNNIAIKLADAALQFDLSHSTINNCNFYQIDIGIYCADGTYGCKIKDNFFYNIYSNGIWMNNNPYTAQDTIIEGNIFSTINFSSSANASLVTLKKAKEIWVKNNKFISTSSGAASKPMLYLESQSQNVTIENNTFSNTSTTGQGFNCAVYITSAELVDINKNTFTNFSGDATSTTTIRAAGGQFINIIENNMTNCRAPLYGTSFFYSSIKNNIINTTGSMGVCVETSAGSVNNYIGNLIYNYDVTPGAPLVSLTTAGDGYGLISNNIFSFDSSSSFSLVSVAENGYVISNNQFMGQEFTGFAAYPLSVLGNYAIIIGNDFNGITGVVSGAAAKIGMFSNSIDVLNKGQLYSVFIPLTNAMPDKAAAAHVSGSYAYNGIWRVEGGYYQAQEGDLYSTFNGLYHYFSSRDVPTGATIKSATLWYNISGGGTTANLDVYWYKYAGVNTSATDVRALQSAGGTGPTEIIYPTSKQLMGQDHEHGIALIAVAGGTFSLTYKGMVVTYQL